jgi:uncharacterized membrane protein
METTFYKALHVFAVVIFLGNIVTGLFWMRWAVKTKDVKIMHHAMGGIIVSDRWFTIPGVLSIILFGFLGAIKAGYPIFGTGWILWSIILFSLSGIAFGIFVAPLQKKIHAMTAGNGENFDWNAFGRLYKSWDLWGLFALLTPLGAFVMMVLKVPA